jgi:hypothetical protein
VNIFALLRIFGKSFISKEIKSTLDHHLSVAGAAQLAANLQAAGTALASTPPNNQAAADALADVVLSIH